MSAAHILPLAAVLLVLIAVSSSTQISPVRLEHSLGEGKKGSKVNPGDLYKVFMVVKDVLGFMLMFVGPIVQIKNLGLGFVNTVVNIARLFFMIQSSQSSHHQIHLTQQPYSYSQGHHQSYNHNVQPQYGLTSESYGLPSSKNFNHLHTYSSDHQPNSIQSYSSDIQPAYLQSYTYKSQGNSEHVNRPRRR